MSPETKTVARWVISGDLSSCEWPQISTKQCVCVCVCVLGRLKDEQDIKLHYVNGAFDFKVKVAISAQQTQGTELCKPIHGTPK